jgi:AraC-like DNA-binding protein
VHGWHVQGNTKTGCLAHTTNPDFGYGLLAPVVSHVFKALRVSASLWEHGLEWLPIHIEPGVSSFEPEHAVEEERYAYNTRLFADVNRKKKIVRGEHAGFSDLFAPVVVNGKVVAVLVTGPFALARPTSADILARWRWLTGRQGHPADSEFLAYLSATFATLVLDADGLQAFEQLVGSLALLMAENGPADAITNDSERARVLLEQVRRPERMWDAVREMVDERSARTWHSAMRITGLSWLGLSRVPDHVLVGLAVDLKTDGDPVDEAVRRHALQRRAVELAYEAGDAISGQVGDHGVSFLCASTRSPGRTRQKLVDLAERASSVARRELGLSLHCGIAAEPDAVPRSYQVALAAAESALVQGAKVVVAQTGQSRPAHSIRHLREELGRAVEEQPDRLGARFDRYMEAVAVHSGHRVEPVRAHLEVGFERMSEPLVKSGVLDDKSFAGMRDGLDRAAGEARTLGELFAAYRQAVVDLSEAVKHPAVARHDRSLRRALEHIRQHYTEPLRLAGVARLSGIAPKYFSRLFREREGIPFEGHVARLRIERAKQLLTSTTLGIARVAELSGHNSSPYFCRAFRVAVGVTPLAFRRGSPRTSRDANKANSKWAKVQRPGPRRR